MPRPPSQHPTDLELEILKTLWRRGPSTVRQVRDALAAGAPGSPPRPLAYTSVMTVLTIMTTKGYLRRAKSDGTYVYHAAAARHSTVGGMLRDLVDRAFAGSAGAAALNLLETSDLTPDELRQLRDLIDRKAQQPSQPKEQDP
jgi:BlaI family transcriptional regulator, penicillinase repressor